MRFASTASRLAGRRLPHPPYPHRRHQLPAARSRTAGGLALTAIEGRFAGFGLLTSSNSTALRRATKAASGSIQLPSFDDQAVQADFVRVTGCLDAIHPGIHNGASCVAGDSHRPERTRPCRRRASADAGALSRVVLVRRRGVRGQPAMAGELGRPLRPGSCADTTAA